MSWPGPLAELLGITHESRAGTLQALFTYIRLHKLAGRSAPPSQSTSGPAALCAHPECCPAG